jgi:hypothetical protein
MSERGDSPDIVLDAAPRQLWTPLFPRLRIQRHTAHRPIRRSDNIGTKDEIPRRVESFPGAQERSPPVFDVGAPCEGVTDDHDIVLGFVQFSPGLVGYGYVGEGLAGFESEFGDDGVGLVDESCIARRWLRQGLEVGFCVEMKWSRLAVWSASLTWLSGLAWI